MKVCHRDVRKGRIFISQVFRSCLFTASFLVASFAASASGADGDPVELDVQSSPPEAGQTDPAGIVAATAGTPLQLTAEAAVGWKFSKWLSSPSDAVSFEDEGAERSFVIPSADAEITAVFEAGQTFTVTTSVYPEGAGSVTVSGTQLNAGDFAEITAVESSQDSIFYKWTCSEGAEVLDPGSSKTQLRLGEGAETAEISVTAHFLTRGSGSGSAEFKSSYRGNTSSLSSLRKNKAILKAVLPADLSGIALSKDCVLSMVINAGSITEEHSFSEDRKSKIKEDAGHLLFKKTIPGSGKASGSIRLDWDEKGFELAYTIKPPCENNLANLYSQIYKQGEGRRFQIDSSQSAGIPAAILVEDSGCCFIWIADGGLDYSGKAKSSPSKKINDDIVSWNISGQGAFVCYSWRMPAQAAKAGARSAERLKSLQGVAVRAARHLAGARKATKIDIDTGNATVYPIWQQAGFSSYKPIQTQSPFFFNGKLYALSRPASSDPNLKKSAFVSTGSMDDNGFVKMEKSYPVAVGDPNVALFGDSTRVTTCVFKGKVYLFYDIYISDNYFYIYSCSSSHPEATWENKGFLPMVGTYTRHGGFKHTPLKAVPFNGKIYLIYGAPDGRFHIQSSPDGDHWTHVYTLDDAATWNTKYLGEMNACTVTKDGQMMLCIAILGTEQNDRWMYLRFINVADKLVGGSHYYLDWVSPHHGIGIAPGTISGSGAQQAVQIFAQSSSWEWYTHVRACTIDVNTYNFEGWRNLPVKVTRDRITYCDAVEAVTPVSKDKNDLRMRKQIVLFSDIEWGQLAAVALKSDLYSPDGPPLVMDTSKGAYRDKSGWSLLGVIHGVPPFTRNGNRAKTSVSQVEYIRKSSQSSKHDYEFEAEAWVNLGVTLEATYEEQGIKAEAGINLKDTLSLGWGWREEVESETKSTFYSDGLNKDGGTGQLVFLAPTLKSQPFYIYDQSGSIKLLSYNIINVSNLNLEFEDFQLDNPPKGMTPRSPTSDLIYWWKNTPPISCDPYFFDFFSNNITVTQSKDGEGTLSRNWAGYFHVGNKASVSIYAKGKLLVGLGLKGEVGAGLSFIFNYTQEESWGETMKYYISELPAPKENSDTQVDRLVVSATWYHPKPQTNLQNIRRPEWIPEEYGKQVQIPWLLTWEINSLEGSVK